MTRSRSWVAVGCLVVLMACRDKPVPPAPPVETPAPAVSKAPSPAPRPPCCGSLANPAPQAARVELGYETDASGSIPKGLESRQFAAASSFVLAVKADDLQAGLVVTARWLNGEGVVLSTQAEVVRAGGRFVVFHAPDTARWPAGAYRTEVRVGDAQPTGIDYRIERSGGGAS